MTISKAVREQVSKTFNGRCAYCLMHSRYIYASMEIDHIIPKSSGGTDREENLSLACPRCNSHKGEQITAIDPITNENVKLFNPREQIWREHFKWRDDSTQIVGQTPCGRATVIALKLNIGEAVNFRALLVTAGWHPPKDL